MVLDSKTGLNHKAMLGRKIQHPTSTGFHDDHPSKRLKTSESTDGNEDYSLSGDERGSVTPITIKDEIYASEAASVLEGDDKPPPRPTDLESALPLVKNDKDAIAEYEAMKAAEQEDSKRLHQRPWVKGKSSIYVDAFNLALETVLEYEGHLFNEKEMEVFEQWRILGYEAQYL